MKGSYLGLGIFGILLVVFGTVFALQGDGILGGSAMSGNSFWIYAGSVIVVLGVIIALVSFYFGSRNQSPPNKANGGVGIKQGSSPSS
jgi:membrane protease YdiL (CAAX protease family)